MVCFCRRAFHKKKDGLGCPFFVAEDPNLAASKSKAKGKAKGALTKSQSKAKVGESEAEEAELVVRPALNARHPSAQPRPLSHPLTPE